MLAAPTKTTSKPPNPVTHSPQEVEILDQIDHLFTALNTTATLLPVDDREKGNRYEIYLYLRLARLLKRQASAFVPVCQTAGVFYFNKSPGRVNAAHSYFAFTYDKHDFELRNGVEFQGRSMNHEVDISISTPLTANTYGPHEALRLAVECKYHRDRNNLKSQFRSQAGTVLDLNGHGPLGCLRHGVSFHAFFACQHEVNSTKGYQRYLRSYFIGPLFNFHPASSDRAAAWRLVWHFLRRPQP